MTDHAKLKPYVWQPRGDDWCMLVFAYTSKQARRLGWESEPSGDVDYIDGRCRLVRDDVEYIMTLRRSDNPHVIDDPPSCPTCEAWAYPIHGNTCGNCEEPPQ